MSICSTHYDERGDSMAYMEIANDMLFTEPVTLSEELKKTQLAQVYTSIDQSDHHYGRPDTIQSCYEVDSQYGYLASSIFTKPLAITNTEEYHERDVKKLSLIEVQNCLYTRGKGSSKGELVANFVLQPTEIREVQKVANGDFEAETITFRVNMEGCRFFYVSVILEKIEKLDSEITKKQGRCVVLNRTAFNAYVQELRALTAECLRIKRVSLVEGWIEDEKGDFFHTSFSPDVYVTNRDYSVIRKNDLDIPNAVIEGTKFLAVGQYGPAIQAMFLTAHACYLYPFLKKCGLRPEFLVVLEAPSGSYKTGVSRELYNVFQDWENRLIAVNNSTTKGILKGIVAGYRHESCIVDDVAPGSQVHLDKSRLSIEGLTRFLSDKGQVVKSNLSQSVDVTKAPEVVCIVTAETGMLTSSESSDARHLTIRFKKGDLILSQLIQFTNRPEIMQRYFVAFIRYLYQCQTQVIAFLVQNKEDFLEKATRMLPNAHPRIVGNLKVLLAINAVVSNFEEWARLEESFIRSREAMARQAVGLYCGGAEKERAFVCTEELFLELLRKGLNDDGIKVVTIKVLREMLLDAPQLDITTIAITGTTEEGRTIIYVKQAEWYKKLQAYASDSCLSLDKSCEEMMESLQRKGYTAWGDSGKRLTRMIPSKINSQYKRERWLAIYIDMLF